MCNKSDSIINIAKALAEFNAEIEKIDKDGTNPHFKNQYSTLDNIIDHVKPVLAKNGLSVLQFPGGDGERITVRTMLIHTSGEYIESEPLVLRPSKNDPQGAGSAITYGRRYSLAAALSLSLGDDDDGNAASAPKPSNGGYNRQESNYGYPPPPPEDYSSLPPQTESRPQNTGGSATARVYKLREQLNMAWPDLNKFASTVLSREIKYLKNDVKSEDEWLMIERALKEAV